MNSSSRRLKVGFAPDWRAGVPYQTHLAEALERHNVNVDFLSSYKRGLPLTRGIAERDLDLLHLHWPEAYFENGAHWSSLFRILRYPLDLKLATRKLKLVLTAHNLLPHDQGNRLPGTDSAIAFTMRNAAAIFVHSKTARWELSNFFNVPLERCHIVPFGDLSLQLGLPQAKELARRKLGLPLDERLCLIFGTVSPYKGSDEVVEFWKKASIPHRLVIVGRVISDAFAARLRELGGNVENIDLRISDEWLDSLEVNTWLSAADVTIFNYRAIFSSGAAALARSFGIPIVIPKRLVTVDLDEPHPTVFRFEDFESDFGQKLEAALQCSSDYEKAAEWRDKTSWAEVALITKRIYDVVVAQGVLAGAT